jgi:hypothetical protein
LRTKSHGFSFQYCSGAGRLSHPPASTDTQGYAGRCLQQQTRSPPAVQCLRCVLHRTSEWQRVLFYNINRFFHRERITGFGKDLNLLLPHPPFPIASTFNFPPVVPIREQLAIGNVICPRPRLRSVWEQVRCLLQPLSIPHSFGTRASVQLTLQLNSTLSTLVTQTMIL